MEYYKDLLTPNKKSTARIIIGLIAATLGIAWMIIDYEKQDGYWMQHLNSMFLAVFGIIHAVGGLGYNIERLFGEAFVLINEHEIKIKNKLFSATNQQSWNELQKIDYKPNTLIFKLQNTQTKKLSLSNLDYATIKEIKELVSRIAKEKNIESEL